MLHLTERGTPKLNTVHHARAEALLSAMDTGSVDLLLTSPPYDNLRTYKGFTWNFEYIARQSYRVLKPGGVLVWVVGDATIDGSETLTSMRQALYFVDCAGFRMHDTMIWDKQNAPGIYGKRYEQVVEFMFVLSKGEPNTFNPLMIASRQAGRVTQAQTSNRQVEDEKQEYYRVTVNDFKREANIWRIMGGKNRTTHDAVSHPAMFPEKLAERHILTWSNPGDVVLDYFAGSGTTLKMARNNGRQWIGGDISGEYVALCERRLALPWTPRLFEVSA